MPPKKKTKQPSLKSASGAGFTFEDKAAAMLLSEMLTGVHSLGAEFGVIQKLERQAGDWEPFGDLLLDVPNSDGKLIRCGGSVKSNRLVNANGCDSELCTGMWGTMAKSVFAPSKPGQLTLNGSIKKSSTRMSARFTNHFERLAIPQRRDFRETS
jgi:hypothetical protein